MEQHSAKKEYVSVNLYVVLLSFSSLKIQCAECGLIFDFYFGKS